MGRERVNLESGKEQKRAKTESGEGETKGVESMSEGTEMFFHCISQTFSQISSLVFIVLFAAGYR